MYCYEIYGNVGKKIPKSEQKEQRERAMEIAKQGLDEAEGDIANVDK